MQGSKGIASLLTINGIGKVKAQELIEAGVKTTADLKKKKYFDMLSVEAQYFVLYKPLSIIPHSLISELDVILKDKLKNNPDIKFDIAGSYRRQQPTSHDIDIITTDIIAMKNAFQSLGVIYVYSEGPHSMSFILKNEFTLIKPGKYVKVDIFHTTPQQYIFQLLHSTGSADFNIRVRAQAKRLGYLLNEKGLFLDGKLVKKFKTEREILEFLHIEYKEPKDR